MARTPTPSVASIPQTAPQVKFAVKLTPDLPEGVTLSADGNWLEKTCPACGAVGKVGVYDGRLAESVKQITRRAWVCADCLDDLAKHFTPYTPPEDLQADYSPTAAWAEFRREYCNG